MHVFTQVIVFTGNLGTLSACVLPLHYLALIFLFYDYDTNNIHLFHFAPATATTNHTHTHHSGRNDNTYRQTKYSVLSCSHTSRRKQNNGKRKKYIAIQRDKDRTIRAEKKSANIFHQIPLRYCIIFCRTHYEKNDSKQIKY